MDIGSAGVPIELAETRDYDLIFSTLAAAGHTVYVPTTIYEEIPEEQSLGFESDLLPPPYGTATPEIYEAAREAGLKIAFPADILFPLIGAAADTGTGALQAILDFGGADIIHSVIGYDEAAWRGLDPSVSEALYLQVKAVAPDVPVIQLHAPVFSDDPTAYLDLVAQHVAWADAVGFNVYPISGGTSGARTPQDPGTLTPPGQAIAAYVDYIVQTFPDKAVAMVLQAFEWLDLFSDAEVAQMTAAERELSREPTEMELREMIFGAQGADFLFWFGSSYRSDPDEPLWQSLLDVSALAATGQLGDPVAVLNDVNAADNLIDETAGVGDDTGVQLEAIDPDAIDTVHYTISDTRFHVDTEGRLRVSEGAGFDFESEAFIEFEAVAHSTDGTTSTMLVTIAVGDVVDQVIGTGGTDALFGDVGADWIEAGGGDDYVEGRAGDDSITGGDGNDFIDSGTGHDLIEAGPGDDIIAAGAGDDVITGGDGSDFIDAGTGNNEVDGGAGADAIFALHDLTHLQGTADHDQFVFREGDGTTVLTGFDASSDVLRFEHLSHMSQLSFSSFGSTVRITYDTDTLFVFGLTEDDLQISNFDFG